MDSQAPTWVLYVREGCHLCEQAEAWLREQGVHEVLRIDIDRDLELSLRYGLRVPVLRHRDGSEWDAPWPYERLTAELERGRDQR